MRFSLIAAVAVFACCQQAAQAATVVQFSPQGEAAYVRQVRAAFSDPMVAFGDPAAPPPFEVACAEPGAGRWLDAKTWVYELERDAPPGLACNFALKPGLKTLAGQTVKGPARYGFTTGGPAVTLADPPQGSEAIDEEQIFVLTLSGPAAPESVARNAYCVVAGVADRIPVKLVDGEPRQTVLRATRARREARFLRRDALGEAQRAEARQALEARTVTLQCQQRLPVQTDVTLMWGAGIAARTAGAEVKTSRDQPLRYKTRPAFAASVSCERENAQAACLPIRPLRVIFTSPVSRAAAQAIRLRSAQQTYKPVFEREAAADTVSEVVFPGPFPERAELSVELPQRLVDDGGRPLANAALFPFKTRTADAPPLAKFASGSFGILELNAEPALPITLRKVEPNLGGGADRKASVAALRVTQPASIMDWMARLRAIGYTDGPGEDDSRGRSLLAGLPGVRALALPQPPATADGGWPFEVIGLPMREPGFYVLELQSQRLGSALLANQAPMVVRTAVLVTNLAVHFKRGRENSLVWVTTLDGARPVPGAAVTLLDCRNQARWGGKTNAQGIAYVPHRLDEPDCSKAPEKPPFMVVAHKTDDRGRADMAFAFSTWNDGIEPWRFNLPQDTSTESTLRAHTVFDRTLLRAGETVSMKHLIRRETLRGFELLPANALPNKVRIRHLGSEQEFTFRLRWPTPRWAGQQWTIPAEARLGEYEVLLESEGRHGTQQLHSGRFRVEAFRLPVLTGRIVPPKTAVVSPRELPLGVQLEYVSGGPAAGLPVRVTGMTRQRWIDPGHYDDFAFNFYDERDEGEAGSESAEPERRIVLDKQPLTLDKAGAGQVVVRGLPRITRPLDLVAEVSFADPNGEIQTIAQTIPLWPAGLMVGLKVEGWASVQKTLEAQAVVLDLNGKPVANQPVELVARMRDVVSHRKRLVGGFYAYEHKRASKNLGTVCRGVSNARGLVFCRITLDEPGNVELVAKAADVQGYVAQAASSVWVTQRGELWFEGENQDRMDVLAEKRVYQPGEMARFQVRMPFRAATALVAVEREGIIETQLLRLSGQDPTVRVPIRPEFGPNVFVSVLAVRERLREVPWYSFFVWGWKTPSGWWDAFKEAREAGKPTALVDLSKPAFKFGVAEIRVGTQGHALEVQVKPERDSYPVRAKAKVQVQVLQPDGKPVAAGTQVAVAAVDQALLELAPNRSWELLEAMLQRRGYGVETFTAQMQVVGKRHFGRKAVPAGGGGGTAPTRELFDTLLVWNPAVTLDARGSATVEVPLNDAMTSFRIVAVADAGSGWFGTGQATIRATQDLQVISGLPPVVRDGDRFEAAFTVRNTTPRALEVKLRATATGIGDLAEQRLAIPANEARVVTWTAVAPALDTASGGVAWDVHAEGNGARDAIKVRQKLLPAVPQTVQQATLARVERTFGLSVAPPADALPGRSVLEASVQASLAEPLPGVQRFFEQYPFTCLEQRASKAIGLRDEALWKQLTAQLPLYLDGDGLAMYFPPREGDAVLGSDVLTAYLLAAAHESGMALPEEAKARMESGLIAFVEGRIERRFWAPQRDLDARKLAALEALARGGKAAARLVQSIAIAPNQWPTSAVIDWVAVLRRVPGIPERDERLREAEQVLRARLDYQGTRMGFSTEQTDYWWWLMVSGDANAARLILATLDDPDWKEEQPRLLNGLLQRMRRGAWSTTTANVWGSLAVEKFGKAFEREKIGGHTRLGLEGGSDKRIEWTAQTRKQSVRLPLTGPAQFNAVHAGRGAPWLTVQSLAAVPRTAPFAAGFKVTRTVAAVEQKQPGVVTRGDILRVRLEVEAQADMSWVVVSDPVPAGASILGTGLGRDSLIATAGEKTENDWRTRLAFEERTQEAYRAYYAHVSKGRFATEYTLRINTPGEFALPPTRVEAMYAPETFGETPHPRLAVEP